MANIIYTAGTITGSKNAYKVYGQNTAWLANDVKAKDLLVINGTVHEISSVDSATELTVANAITAAFTTSAYVIVRVSEQVLAPDLAKLLYELLSKYDTDIAAAVKVIQDAKLYTDTDGDLAQEGN